MMRFQSKSAASNDNEGLKNAQSEHLRRHYKDQNKELEWTIQKADVHTQLSGKGVLHIEDNPGDCIMMHEEKNYGKN